MIIGKVISGGHQYYGEGDKVPSVLGLGDRIQELRCTVYG